MPFQVKRYLSVILGCLLRAAAINAFYVPNNMLSGGISGIAMIFYYALGFPIGLTSIVLNVPLFFFAYKLMDRSYFIVSLFGMFVFSFSIDFFRFLADLHITDDALIAALCGGFCNGLGGALMYRVNAGSGGTDIVGGIVNKYYGLSIGTVGYIINSCIMAVGIFLFGIERAIYTFIGIYITGRSADRFTAGLDTKKSVYIISPKNEDIAAEIVSEVGRGVTYLYGEGAYTKQERKIVFVVIKLTQIAKIKNIAYKHDPQAFIIIQDAIDVMGKGFTLKSDVEIAQEEIKEKKLKRIRNIARIHRERLKNATRIIKNHDNNANKNTLDDL